MDGLGRAVGAGVSYTLGDRTFNLAPLTLRLHGLVEQQILADRVSAINRLKPSLEGLSDDERSMLLKEAMDEDKKTPNYATEEETSRFFSTIRGLSFTLWVMVRKNHSDVELEWVEEHVSDLSPAEMQRLTELIYQASGMDEMGNETGLTGSQKKTDQSGENGSTGVEPSEKSVSSTAV